MGSMRLAPLLLLALAGCSDEGPELTPSPGAASQFGQVQLTLSGDVASLGPIRAVRVGGIAAYHVAPAASSLVATIQGAPAAGAADVEVDGDSGRALRHGLFRYDPPAAALPPVWAAFGASLTQGTQSLGVNVHSQVSGVSGLIARQAGVFLGLPLFADGMLPGLTPADFAPDCTTTHDETYFIKGLTTALTDPATNLFDLRRGRIDATLTPRNFAIGGSTVDEVLHGGIQSVGLLEHIVEEPDTDPGQVFARVDVSQVARLEQLDPDLAFCTDLLANDLDGAVTQTDDLHPEAMTPLATITPQLAELAARLGKLHGQYFIANLPSLTFIPNVADLRAKRIAAGLDTAASFDAKVAAIDQATYAVDDALAQAIASSPNLHLVDFRTSGNQLFAQGGTRVGGELLTPGKFGGLISLDNLHFTDTGYAIFANLFIDAIDQALGLQIPEVDVAAVHEGDALTPAKLRALGFTCVPPAG
jgi:lysophospholipase L1-like esterase